MKKLPQEFRDRSFEAGRQGRRRRAACFGVGVPASAGQPILLPHKKVVRAARISGAADEPEFTVRNENEFELKAEVWNLRAQLTELLMELSFGFCASLFWRGHKKAPTPTFPFIASTERP